MGTIFVARSKTISDWGYDVGLSKHLFKVGYTEAPVKDVVAAGWAGATDWSLVKKQDDVEGISEDEIVARLAIKAKMIDPKLYPRIRDTIGIFKVTLAQVENHIVVKSALAGDGALKVDKVKPADIADYLIASAQATSSLE